MRNCRSSKANRTLNTSSTIRLPKRKKPSAKSVPSSTNTSARLPGRSDCGHGHSHDAVRCSPSESSSARILIDQLAPRAIRPGWGIEILGHLESHVSCANPGSPASEACWGAKLGQPVFSPGEETKVRGFYLPSFCFSFCHSRRESRLSGNIGCRGVGSRSTQASRFPTGMTERKPEWPISPRTFCARCGIPRISDIQRNGLLG